MRCNEEESNNVNMRRNSGVTGWEGGRGEGKEEEGGNRLRWKGLVYPETDGSRRNTPGRSEAKATQLLFRISRLSVHRERDTQEIQKQFNSTGKIYIDVSSMSP